VKNAGGERKLKRTETYFAIKRKMSPGLGFEWSGRGNGSSWKESASLEARTADLSWPRGNITPHRRGDLLNLGMIFRAYGGEP